MRYFCTYFDRYYLPRGLCMYRSLKQHCPSFKLWILCLDEASFEYLSRLDLADVHLIALEQFERSNEELAREKQNRTRVEYYFTCTPSLPLFVLTQDPAVELITYLDADLFFFSDPEPIYQEIGEASIAIIEHRFSPNIRDKVRVGVFNVGWLSFRRDQNAFLCLNWWRDRCIEWCYERIEDGRMSDQKYLDDWPARFEGVAVLRHKGANLAPWNVSQYVIRRNRNQVLVDEEPLIFFHFHGLRRVSRMVYDGKFASYKMKGRGVVLRSIYAPYIRMLWNTVRQLSPGLRDRVLFGSVRDETSMSQGSDHAGLLRGTLRGARRLLRLWQGVVARKYLVVVGGRVF